MRFRKKPVEVEAIQWDGQNMDAFNVWLDPPDGGSAGLPFSEALTVKCLAIETLEGTMIAQPGDWIIRGVKGEFYPCKPDVFSATYEAVMLPPPKPLWSIEYEKMFDGKWNRAIVRYDSEFIAQDMAADLERAPGYRVIRLLAPLLN